MDVYEVTNAQYRKFMDATGHEAPWLWDRFRYWDDFRYDAPEQPVVGVTWDDAVAYCQWAGKRLPTEAEWEKAARGGLVGKEYPWGDSITHDNANYAGVGGRDRWRFPAPVGSFPPNRYGLYDMSGNVWEWCADWHGMDYSTNSPKQNPKEPSTGIYRVACGGSYGMEAHILRCVSRYRPKPTTEIHGIGFRCAMQK